MRPVILNESTKTPWDGPNFHRATVFEELIGLPDLNQAQKVHSLLTPNGPVYSKWMNYCKTRNPDFQLDMGPFNMKEAEKFGARDETRDELEIMRNMQTIVQDTDNLCTGNISQDLWDKVTTDACSNISKHISQLGGDDKIIADLDEILDFVSGILLDKEKRKNDNRLYRTKVVQFFRKAMSDLLWANLKCIIDEECRGKYKRMFPDASKTRLFPNAPVVPPTSDDPVWPKNTFDYMFTKDEATQKVSPHTDLIWKHGDLSSPAYDRDGIRLWGDNASLVSEGLLHGVSAMMTQRRITDGVGGRIRQCFTNLDTATHEKSENPPLSVEEMKIGVKHLLDPCPSNKSDIKRAKVGQADAILSGLFVHDSDTRAFIQGIVEAASTQQTFLGACMADVVVRGGTKMVEKSRGTMVISEELREEAKGAPDFAQESDVRDLSSGSDFMSTDENDCF